MPGESEALDRACTLMQMSRSYLVKSLPLCVVAATAPLQVGSLAELDALLAAARARGLVAHSVSDAGRTEVEAGTKTVGCVGPGPRSEVDAVCRHLSLL